jgi:PAS domain S-box-containing protein
MVKVEQGMFYKKTGFITLAVIVSLLCIITGWFVYEQEISKSREEAEKDMKAIGELKTKQIADWYKERIDEIEIRTISPYLSSAIEKLLKDSNNRIDREKVYKLLKAHKRETHFDEIMLSSKDGELILATSNEIKEFDTLLVSKIKLAVKNRTIQITDIYFNQYLNKPVIDFLSPIFDEERVVIAVMIFRIDPEDYLYPFLQSWLPTVKTFETLLVRADGDSVVFLNELKFKKNTALKLKFPMHRQDIPAVKAVSGHKGIFEGKDYRGVPVISYLSHVPGTKWYLVTKINKSELLKDSMGRAVSIILIIALFVIGVILLFIYIYNARQKSVYKKLFEAEQEFETTLYSIGDAVITTDKSGKIKYMNPVAELLTGWAEKEAKGYFIEDVFKIINEETRAKVENPVVKVLREGLVVGLANHTLLISKDGLEIPIADSGAPIKDENGEIIGIVLVFRDQTAERVILNALKESEEKYRQIFESANVGKSITKPSGKISVNKAFCDMLGYSEEELQNKTWQELTPPEEIETISAYLAPLLEGKTDSVRFEKRYIHKNGAYIWCDVSAVLRRDEKGNPLHFITTIVDINEKRKIESEKQLFSKVLENTLNEIYIFDDKTLRFVNVNLGARENLGYTLEELKSMTPLDLKPEFTEQKFREMIKPLLEKEISRLVFETVHKRKDGSLYPVEVFLYYRKSEGMLTAIINDITERKRDEEALKKSEALYRTTLYSIGDAVITTDINGKIMQLNPVSEELTGWKEDEAKGKALEEVFNIISEIDRKKVENPVVKVLREGLVVGLANHTLLISKDGLEIPIADSGAPIKDENGEIIGVVLVFRDQTAERVILNALKESEEKYRKLIEVSPDGIIIHQNGIIKYANQSAAKIGGYDSTDELIGKNAIEFVHPDYREMALRRIRDTIMKGERAVPMEEKFIQKDGSILDVEVTATTFLLNNETAVQTIIRDISERKKKEAELFEAKDILEKIYLGIKDGIVIIDSKSKNITGCNYAAENIFRYSYNEMLGKHISILLQKNEQINFKEIATKFSTGKDNEFQPVSEILQRKDSMLFPATYTVLPLTDKNNKIIRFVLIVRDMSEEVKKEQERKLVNQRLRVFAEHLQSVREDERTSIAREIHDEIGQALSVMNMNLSIMERDYLKDAEKINIDGIKEEINSMKEFIMKTVEKMRKLIINLRPEVVEDLEITEAIEWLVKEFSKDNKIDCVFNKEVEKIGISKDETMSLFRIAQEALRNVARHSGATKAEVTIRKNNKNYEMIISDNGKGFNINEVNYKKSFGLTGIRERVEILNGKVDVITELNKGTKIVVKFHKEN